jgi:hypothetical protein
MMEEEEEGERAEEEEVSLGVIMTNTEIKFQYHTFHSFDSSCSQLPMKRPQ